MWLSVRQLSRFYASRSKDAATLDQKFVAQAHSSLSAVESVWRTFEDCGDATAFQRFEWANAICEGLLPPKLASLVIIEVSEVATHRPLMLLPMVRLQRRGYSAITWLDMGVSDYSAPVMAPGLRLDASEAREMWKAVRRALPKTDVIQISRIPSQVSRNANPFVALPNCRRMDVRSYAVSLAENPDGPRCVKRKTMKEMRRKRRNLAKLGPVRLVTATTSTELDEILDALVVQRRERFREMGRFNLLDRPDVENFYRSAAHCGLSNGSVQLFGLCVNDELIAAAYGVVHDETFYLLIPTFADGPWRSFAPALLLIADIFDWLRAHGVNRFDFSIGEQQYKDDFGGVGAVLFELWEANSLRGAIMLNSVRSATALKSWLRERPGLFRTLRSQIQRLRRWRSSIKEVTRRDPPSAVRRASWPWTGRSSEG